MLLDIASPPLATGCGDIFTKPHGEIHHLAGEEALAGIVVWHEIQLVGPKCLHTMDCSDNV